MLSSLEKLRRFFSLERQKGFDNTAVIGGLVKILDFWESEARAEGVEEAIVQAVVQRLRNYESLTPQGRAEVLKGLWKRISETYPEAAQKLREKPRPASQSTPPPKPSSLSPASPEESEPLPAWLQPEPASAETPAPAPLVTEASPTSLPSSVEETPSPPAALDAPLTVLQGVGPRHARMLAHLGLHTLGDLLYYFPRRYEDYTQLKPIKNLWVNEQVTVIGTIQSVEGRSLREGKIHLVEAILNDGTGALRLAWFNQPWMVNRVKVGDHVSVSGKIDQYLGRLVMNNPEIESLEIEHLHTNRIVPVYSLTANLRQKWLRRIMNQVIPYWAVRVPDPLPAWIRQAADLMPLGEALRQAHFPDSHAELKRARQRLAFDEIFLLQMGVLRQKRDWQSATATPFSAPEEWMQACLQTLPFPLTTAQQRALAQIRRDLASGRPMNRLLQGDVGSGKTVIAALAAAIILQGGAQVAVMAPTSILAEQHFRTFSNLLPDIPVRLLIGDTPESEKAEIRAALADGSLPMVVGTHALIEETVTFANLQLAVIDEQHRFGVEQRAALRRKGTTPHLLVMTATPIPRSLALTLYGDLDLTVMDELPAGRRPVQTYVLRPQERERAYTLIRSQIEQGRQAFIVYPLIEESEKLNHLKAAVDDYERLSTEIFPDLRLGLLHGRMRPDEKERIMADFRDGHYHILVSTTVIEVGVDVPNATVMLIEGANRFGLAQLHQLRGRVGRGGAQSYCLLIPDRQDEVENERLQAMVETHDGFVLAERDLQQRGPGEFLGTRQAGFTTSLKMANLSDVALIEKARAHAQSLFEQDPALERPEHRLLAQALERFWRSGQGDIS